MLTVAGRRTAHGRRVFVIAATVLTGALLASCTGGEAHTEPVPDATPGPPTEPPVLELVEPAPAAMSGRGSAYDPALVLDIPEGSQSLRIDFHCAGPGDFSVSVGSGQAVFGGSHYATCDGASDFTWPITETFRTTMAIVADPRATWTATPTFSSAPFVPDLSVSADCDATSPVLSAFSNADLGYTVYSAFDETEWRSRIARATAELDALIASTQSSLRLPLVDLRSQLSTVAGSSLERAHDSIGAVHRVCNRNHTAIYYVAEFGG
jgi:hypothetical protein